MTQHVRASTLLARLPPFHINGGSALPLWTGMVAASVSVAAVSAAIAIVRGIAAIANLSMLYLVPVLVLAIVFGRGAGVSASLLAFLTYNWFFIEPRFTLTIQDPAEWLTLLLFLLVALVCSELAAGVRRRAQEAEQREREALWLYQLGEVMAAPGPLPDRLTAAAQWLLDHLDLAAATVSAAGDGMRLAVEGCAGAPDAAGFLLRTPLDGASGSQILRPRAAAPDAPGRRRWIRLNRGTPVRAGHSLPWDVRTAPLLTSGQRVGTLRLARPSGAPPFTLPQDRLLAAAAARIALTVERARLQAAANEAAALRRAGELKTALLDAVSHDLRTPLAGIKASAGSLRQKEVQWSEADRDSFAAAIEQEADRLDRLVGHLLDLSRIESGSLQAEKQLHVLGALVDDVLARLAPLLAGRPLAVEIPHDLPPVPLDYVQISEALTNLVENATRHTPPGAPLRISARQEGESVEVRVCDAGPGIPPEALPRVFEKFYRGEGAAGRRSPRGAGLGLAVARGMVEAHGGRIWAESAPGQGASFIFTLPLAQRAAAPPRAEQAL